VIAMTFSPFWCLYPENPIPSPLFWPRCGPVALEHADVELFLRREMPHTRHKRLPERAIIRPSGKDFVDGRIVDGRLALGVVRHGQTLPLHPGVEDPQDEVKDPLIAQFALGTALGHREVWQDKCLELGFRELDRNRCRYRLWGFCAHQARASWEEWRSESEKRIT
jgi:hypothetical protein